MVCTHDDTVAEWLRREIRNLLEFLRAGSSPVGVDNLSHNSNGRWFKPGWMLHRIYSSVAERSIAEQLGITTIFLTNTVLNTIILLTNTVANCFLSKIINSS
mmetsp:Transcript_18595/g.20070  ORF Transcript_18595/g.20070 Transcript_18595/m.20070 type:complete len:102 (+) Transcript_18595:190-495(+)